jgi:hypothetical protein
MGSDQKGKEKDHEVSSSHANKYIHIRNTKKRGERDK